jgi:Ca2+-binding RTX toxin-like protein
MWGDPSATRRRASVAVLAAAGLMALSGVAQAGELVSSGGVLTYTGGDADNNVFVTHPNDPAFVHIVDAAAGDGVNLATAPAGCVPDDISFGLVCPTPTRLVLNLGGGADSFSDDTNSGTPIAVPLELNGGAGNDQFDGGGAADLLMGGPGDDTLVGDGGNDVLRGEDGADTVEGGADADDLDGGVGNDRLTGGAGNDLVRGGDGDDELDYRPLFVLDGADVFDGGAGYDKVGYFGRTVAVAVSLDGQANDGQAGEGDNIAADVDEVDGGDAADVLVGSDGPNRLAGRGGDDQVVGGGGDDVLYGDTGNDGLDGGAGNDSLDGGCMDDIIVGGPGVDSLNADGTCANPALRGQNDVLQARDGVKDALVLCAMGSTAEDTAVVDAVDPALGPGNPGACRTIDAGTTPTPPAPPPPGPTPGGGTPGGPTPLKGTVRARLGSTVRLLTGNGAAGQAVRWRADVKARVPTLTLGSLVATAASRVGATATVGKGRGLVALGTAAVTVRPGTPRVLTVKLSKRGAAALRGLATARIAVRFVVRHPTTKKVLHRSTKTFRVPVRR